ncbi:hypothetical protein [Nostoc sp. DSM 114161]|uniref:hypothetical protein n=1 Tax=Nostoc sp. DSM 114161 TaxID=3440143 RepID=UPI00404664B6
MNGEWCDRAIAPQERFFVNCTKIASRLCRAAFVVRWSLEGVVAMCFVRAASFK